MAKLRIYVCWLSLVLFGLAPAAPSSAAAQREPDIPRSEAFDETPIYGPFYDGDGGSGTSLAVLQPAGINLDENEQWVLSFIQGMLSANLGKYSGMSIRARQDLDKALEGQQSSFELSAAESVKIGGLVNAQFILTGSLQKITASEFLFQLVVINTETGVRRASHIATVSDVQLRNADAVKTAAGDLLGQLGVALTENGKLSLQQKRTSEVEAEIALARGIDAEKRGNTIETLNYLYNAVSYNVSLPEADSRLNSLSALVSSGGLGDAIRSDLENRTQWRKILDEFEAFYTEHPPFEIVYEPNPKQSGITDYEAAGGATVNLNFIASFRESSDLSTMRKVYQNIQAGLTQTKKQENWGFAGWPYSLDLFAGFKDYTVTADLINDNEEVLKTLHFTLSGRLLVLRNKIYPDSKQDQVFLFTQIPVDQLTSTPRVKIVSINGIDAVKSGEDGYIRIVPMEKMPAAYPRNFMALATRDFFNVH